MCCVYEVLLLGLILTLVEITSAALIVDDDLASWDDYWAGSNSIIGVTSSSNYYSSPIHGKYTAFRVSNCPDDDSPCYSAELSNTTALDSTGEYWFGFSTRLHDQWIYDSSTDDQISAYFFRITGSLQSSPQFSLRYTGLSIVARVCGNDALDSETEVCEEQYIGTPAPGSWDHWVVHDSFSHTDGNVEVWRNGVSVYSASSLPTSYRNTQSPALSIGLLVDSWNSLAGAAAWEATGLMVWMETHYRRVKVGASSSSYAEVYTGGESDFTMGTEFAGTVTLAEALVRDIMPPSSPLCVGDGRTSFTFEYTSTYNISKWDDLNKDFEDDVFLAELKHEDDNVNKSWSARVAPGGNIYSYIHDVMGELMAPQYHELGPFNDEVWQIVMVDTALHDADLYVNGMNRKYFIHQAGQYQKDSDLLERPFVSPSVAYHCEGRECLFCGWGQQAHVPTRQTSHALYYTRFKDCGDGVMEQTWMVHNGNPAGMDTFSYTNVPWGGIRTSVLNDAFHAKLDGTGMDQIDPLLGFGSEYRPNLEDIGGYSTFAQDVPMASNAYDLPCGDGTGADLDCSDPAAVQVSLTIRGSNSAVESASHTAAWGRYTVRVDIETTVMYHVPCNSGCEFRATNPRGEYVDLKGVMRWAHSGTSWYMWPITDTEVEVNAKFLDGDVINITRIDNGKPFEQNLAFSWVFGTNEEYNVQFNRQGSRSWVTGKDRVRIGTAGTIYDRDYTVFTVNVFMEVVPGNTFYYRQYVLPGRLTDAHEEASKWVPESRKGMRMEGDMPGSTVMIYATDGTVFGAGIQDACAPIRCNGSTTPQPNTLALYAITCGVLNYVGHDPYFFAPNYTNVSKPIQPYICNDQIPIRPTWQLLGYFAEGACDFVQEALYRTDLCSLETLAATGLSYFFRPYVDTDRKKDLQSNEDCSLVDSEQPHLQVPLTTTAGMVIFRGSHGAYGSSTLASRVVEAPDYPTGPLSTKFEQAKVYVSEGVVDGGSSYHNWNQELYSAALYEDLLTTSSSSVEVNGEYTLLPAYEAAVQMTVNSSFASTPIPHVVEHVKYIASVLGFRIKAIKWCA
mmetsp:Transcript_9090/g.15369  ORF Transcript_9090/g.15369 Transcript_9090/m.15369 type:complete len:1069 (+) Transcript_9090:87-3293(+)